MAPCFVLKEVESIHRSGATKMAVSNVSTAYQTMLKVSWRGFLPGRFGSDAARAILVLPPSEQREIENTDQGQEESQHVAHRRRAPHVEVLQTLFRYVHDGHAGFVRGCALGDEVGLAKHVRRGEDRYGDYQQQHRTQPR